MGVTTTTRLELTRWSADTDPLTRSQLDTTHSNLESRAAVFLSGTNRGAYNPVTYVRSFFYDTDDEILYYSDGVDWQNLSEFGLVGAISTNTPGNVAAAGDDDTSARADHVHATPSFGSTGELAQIGTTAAQGNNDKFARINHVHVLGLDSVIAGTVAAGAIDSSDVFTSGVVDSLAIGTEAVGRAAIEVSQRIPIGSLMPFAGATAPSGWLFCDGTSLAVSAYGPLHAVIGYQYGGSGANFNVPDLRGRVPVGLDNIGGTDAARLTAANTLGGTGGTETHTLTSAQIPAHTHTQTAHNHTQSSHNHNQNAHAHSTGTTVTGSGFISFNAGAEGGSTTTGNQTAVNQAATAVNIAATAVNQDTGGGGSHNNLQPYLLINYIIKT